jgi:hypothetical protein
MPANKVKKYLKNLDKETTQAGNAGETLKKAKGTSKEKAAADKLRNERGQMFGALLQGRRYDEKGKQINKPTPKKPVAPRTPSKGTKTTMPKTEGAKPGVKKPMPKTVTKAPAKMTPKPKTTKKPEKMTPQDAAMKKLLEKKYGKIYG